MANKTKEVEQKTTESEVEKAKQLIQQAEQKEFEQLNKEIGAFIESKGAVPYLTLKYEGLQTIPNLVYIKKK